jgi:peroxiredoxin
MIQKHFLAIALALISLVGFVSAIVMPMGSGYKVGDTVKNFTLKNIDSKSVSLSDFQNSHKGIILTFTCNHCPYAKLYEQRLIDLHKKYADQGYIVVAVNPNAKTVEDDSFENMVSRAKEKNYPFVYLNDEDQNVAKTFGAEKTPQIYLLQNDGVKYTLAYIGAIDNDPQDEKSDKVKYVENAIEDLKNGRPVATTQTKAVGCTVKWIKK